MRPSIITTLVIGTAISWGFLSERSMTYAQVQSVNSAVEAKQTSNQQIDQQVQSVSGDSVTFVGSGSNTRTIEFQAGSPPSDRTVPPEVSQEYMVRWHIRQNVCNGNLEPEELVEIFPQINLELVPQVCGS
jgi:hypothetical protein